MTIKFKTIIITTLLLVFSFQIFSFSMMLNRIFVNDKLLPVTETAVFKNYSNLISSSFLKSELGFSIWENKNDGLIYLKKDDKLLVFIKDDILINWKKSEIKTIPERINGELYFQASFISQVFDIPLSWNSQYKFIRFYDNPKSVSSSVYESVYSSVYTAPDSELVKKYGNELVESMKYLSKGILPPQKPKKTAYLTFDDGPDAKATPIILDTLKKYEVKATFFLLGEYAKNNPELVKRVHNEGHTIGNHSYSHKSSIYSSFEKFKSEVNLTSNIILKLTGEHTKLFRPPYGNKMNSSYRKYLRDSGYRTFLWNIDSGDSRARSVPSETIVKNVANSLYGKKDIVIIMHDGNSHLTTAYALEDIIKILLKNGYEIKPLTPEVKINAQVEIR